ncbi:MULTISPECIES: hypothetical protein [Acinetobacter]|uniref:hypothetical protein n=1 Tax=Acinetobacter TaxID=469 RepID=UPI00257D4135|nr:MULTISPECIES: hypothetical protein [Acinetobacter]
MNSISNETAILNTIANCVDKASSIGPFRNEDAKSTFYVEPKLHRRLEVISEYTGLTKQEIYSKALRKYVIEDYLEDLDIESFIEASA